MTITLPIEQPWSRATRRLRKWLYAYLLLWGSGLAFVFGTTHKPVGVALVLLSVFPYGFSIVDAHEVQHKLHAAGLYKHGAWQVVVGALLLNPFVLGFLIPISVLWTTHRINRRLAHRPTTYAAGPS